MLFYRGGFRLSKKKMPASFKMSKVNSNVRKGSATIGSW